MEINRKAVKNQARQMLGGWVLKLFVVALVVSVLTGASVSLVSNVRSFTQTETTYSDEQLEEALAEYDSYPSGGNFFEEIKWTFEHSFLPHMPQKITVFGVGNVMRIIFAPLEMALCGLFMMFIQGRRLEVADEFRYVFTTGFDKRFGNKVLLGLVKSLVIGVMTLLLIVPGIVFGYKYFFTSYIIAEHPELSWSEALKRSDALTKGHKGELFMLDLSFLPWYLLNAVTLGLANIYFMPYYRTVIAMYYYNFTARALQNGELTQA